MKKYYGGQRGGDLSWEEEGGGFGKPTSKNPLPSDLAESMNAPRRGGRQVTWREATKTKGWNGKTRPDYAIPLWKGVIAAEEKGA